MPARPSPLRRPNPLGARACGIAPRIRWTQAARTLPVPPAGARRVRDTLGRGAASPPASVVPAGHSGKLLGQWRREGRQGGERRRRGPGGQQPSPPGSAAASRPGGIPPTDPRPPGQGKKRPPRTLGSHQSRGPHPPLDSPRCARAAARAALEAAAVPARVKAPRRSPAPGKKPAPPPRPAAPRPPSRPGSRSGRCAITR
ncbi:uncharacterized protein LOC132374732 isoform X1 [Balaenoptera ricei]|uniref:uncharacterized protein LOC132374732 isoform X1 n=1 Tax=Balaenoptera ricei TaxID=2746895 RepID=UPI0028BD8787|nr:uncharacterized protein LOC132374732 isoform X1 [Balaenoptera ricei]